MAITVTRTIEHIGRDFTTGVITVRIFISVDLGDGTEPIERRVSRTFSGPVIAQNFYNVQSAVAGQVAPAATLPAFVPPPA